MTWGRGRCAKERWKAVMCCIGFLQLVAIPLRAAPAEATIAGRQVSLTLVKAEDFSPAPWPEEVPQLTTESVTVHAGETIYDLLMANEVEPDVEAYTLVYDLNPLLSQIDPVPTGLLIVLPKIRGGDKLEEMFGQGYRVMLTVDDGLRKEIAQSASDLQELSRRFESLSDNRFANASIKQAMVSNIRALADWFAYIQKSFLRRTGPPLRRQTLVGMRDEGRAIGSLVSGIVGGQQQVTDADQEQVNAIHRDMQAQIKKYDNVMAGEPPAGESQYKIVVTIHGGDAKLAQGMQVYWAYQGLFRKPPREPIASQPFDGVGSGSSVSLTSADYVIWAAWPGHPVPPVTDQKPISIGPIGDNPRQVGLSITQ
jgi:hypothetical protein